MAIPPFGAKPPKIKVQSSGVTQGTRSILNIIGATVADNPTTKAVDITITDVDTGYIPYTGATTNVNLGANNLTALQLISTQTTGTAPFTVASTTVVTNLNADLLDGNHASAFLTVEADTLATVTGRGATTATASVFSTSLSTPSLISTGAIGITPLAGTNLNINLGTTGDLVVNTNQLYIDTSAGNVGIGTTTPGYNLEVSAAGGGASTMYIHNGNTGLLLKGASALIESLTNMEFQSGASNNLNYLFTSSGNSQFTGNVGIGTTSPNVPLTIGTSGGRAIGLSGSGYTGGTGTGVEIVNYYNATGNKQLMFADSDNLSSASIPAFKVSVGSSAVYFNSFYPSNGNAAPAYFDNLLYSDGTSKVTISGNVGIGTTSPTAVLHLKAGTATAGTAPLKLTSGTLLITPELGALEFTDNGTTSHLYVTINIAGVLTRYTII